METSEEQRRPIVQGGLQLEFVAGEAFSFVDAGGEHSVLCLIESVGQRRLRLRFLGSRSPRVTRLRGSHLTAILCALFRGESQR